MNSSDSDIQLEKATRAIWVFLLVPVLIIVILGVIAYNMTSRINELEGINKEATATQRFLISERILDRSSNYTWAINQYEEMIKDYEKDIIYNKLGGLYAQTKQYEKARAILERSIEINPENWEAYNTLIFVHLAMGDHQAAIDAGERALELNPLSADAHNNLAWIYAVSQEPEIRDEEKALNYATEAVNLTYSSNAEILDTLSTVHFEMGNYEAALNVINEAIKLVDKEGQFLEKRRKIREEME